jgi:hypothetical protein
MTEPACQSNGQPYSDPHISGLGGVESRWSLDGVDDVVEDQDQRFEVRDGGGGGSRVRVGVVVKMSKLHEEK